MSGKDKDGTPEFDGLTADLDEWDKAFDDFHDESEDSASVAPPPLAPPEAIPKPAAPPSMTQDTILDEELPSSEGDRGAPMSYVPSVEDDFLLGPAGGITEAADEIDIPDFELGASGGPTIDEALGKGRPFHDDESTAVGPVPKRRVSAHVIRRLTTAEPMGKGAKADQEEPDTRIRAISQDALDRLRRGPDAASESPEDDPSAVPEPLPSLPSSSATVIRQDLAANLAKHLSRSAEQSPPAVDEEPEDDEVVLLEPKAPAIATSGFVEEPSSEDATIDFVAAIEAQLSRETQDSIIVEPEPAAPPPAAAPPTPARPQPPAAPPTPAAPSPPIVEPPAPPSAPAVSSAPPPAASHQVVAPTRALPRLDFASVQLPAQAAPRLEPSLDDDARALMEVERELEASDSTPQAASLRVYAGVLATALDDLGAAQAHFEEAASLGVAVSVSQRGIRRAAARREDWATVDEAFLREANECGPIERRGLLAHRVDCLLARGEIEEAKNAAAELLLESARTARAQLLRLEIAAATDDLEEVASALDELAERVDDSDLSAAIRSGRSDGSLLGILLADPPVGADELEMASNHWSADPSLASGLLHRAALAARAAGDSARAGSLLERAASLAPKDVVAHRAYARSHRACGDFARAAVALQQVAAMSQSNREKSLVLRQAGDAWFDYGDADSEREEAAHNAGAACYREAAALDPVQVLSMRALGAQGDDLASYRDAVDRSIIEADRQYNRIRLAEALIGGGQAEEAAALLAPAAGEGAHPTTLRVLDRALVFAQRFEERADLLSGAAEREGGGWPPLVSAMRAAAAADDVVNHHLLMERSEEVDPERKAIRDEVILGKLDDAFDAWSKVIDLEPINPVGYLARITLARRRAYRTGDVGVLLAALQAARAVAMTPDRAIQYGLRELAIVLGQAGDNADTAAAAVLDALVDVDPSNMRVAMARTVQAIAAGDWEGAADVLTSTAEHWNNGILADGMRYRAAAILVDFCDEAGGALDILTGVVGRHSDYQAAQELMRLAHRRLGGTAIVDANMMVSSTEVDIRADFGDQFAQLIREAEVHEYRSGNPGKALELYKKAWELRPNHPVAHVGFIRAARASGEVEQLADFAMTVLRQTDPADRSGRARAHELVAEVDLELRGDRESAIFSHRSAVEQTPYYMPSLRALERTYGIQKSWAELYEIYQYLLSAIGNVAEAMPLAVEAMRLSGLLDEDDRAAADARRILEQEPLSLPALATLSQGLHKEPPTDEGVEVELALASAYAHAQDRAAAAAFNTRAGDILLALGRSADALDKYRAALALDPMFVPALRSWQRVALELERWPDALAAVQRAVSTAADDEEETRLLHLAAVIAMDRVLDNERAIALLGEVLELQPDNRDAFARLRLLYSEEGRHQELVRLLIERAEVEDDTQARIELHLAASNLYRTYFEDRASAVRELKIVVELEPDHREARTALADMAWEIGAWADAAESLERLADHTNDKHVLRTIYHRLATIYDQHLPDPARALRWYRQIVDLGGDEPEVLRRVAALAAEAGDVSSARRRYEELVESERDPARRASYLRALARLHRDDLDDSPRAIELLKEAFECHAASAETVDLLLRYSAEAGDDERRGSLDSIIVKLRSHLQSKPVDGAAYAALARALDERHRLGTAGANAAAYCAAALAALLGAGSQVDEELIAASESYRPNATAVAEGAVDELLFPRALSAPMRRLLEALGDRIGIHVGIDLRRYGVTREDRLEASHPAVEAMAEMSRAFSAGSVEVYGSKEMPTVVAIEPSAPVSVVLGTRWLAPSGGTHAFIAGRLFKLLGEGLAVPARMSERDFTVLLAAIMGELGAPVSGPDPGLVSEEAAKLDHLIPAGLRPRAEKLAAEAAPTCDASAAWRAIESVGDRAGLLCSGSITGAASVICAAGGYSDVRSATKDQRLMTLLRFAVSEEYIAMCAALGR